MVVNGVTDSARVAVAALVRVEYIPSMKNALSGKNIQFAWPVFALVLLSQR